MKTSILALLFLAFTIGTNAQNKNVLKTTKTKTTTIKDSDGEKKIVKTEKTNEVQNVKLGEEKSNTINIPTVNSPTQVTKTTEISVDGELKSRNVEHSAYYMFGGEKYQIKADNLGYTVISTDASNNNYRGILRKTSNNNYIYTDGTKTSFGYYDNDGNLILETYDNKSDLIKLEKFEILK